MEFITYQQGEIPQGFLANGTTVVAPANATVITWPWELSFGKAFLSLGSDFGDVSIRAGFYHSTTSSWTVDTYQVQHAKGLISVDVPIDVVKISLGRINETGSSDNAPASWALAFYALLSK